MTFQNSVKICFSKYFNYNGCATRSEYWYFILFFLLASIVANIIDIIFFSELFSPIDGLTSMILLIPSLNVTTRRLHDVNKSGWWQLLYFTGIGSLIILYWMCIEGKKENNKYN